MTTKIARLREQRQASTALQSQLEDSGEGQISLTDPDSRAMVAHGKVTIGYTAQVAVDAKHSLIVEQHVTNACNDMGLLAPTAGASSRILSDAVTAMLIPLRIPHRRTSMPTAESSAGLFRADQSTR